MHGVANETSSIDNQIESSQCFVESRVPVIYILDRLGRRAHWSDSGSHPGFGGSHVDMSDERYEG